MRSATNSHDPYTLVLNFPSFQTRRGESQFYLLQRRSWQIQIDVLGKQLDQGPVNTDLARKWQVLTVNGKHLYESVFGTIVKFQLSVMK